MTAGKTRVGRVLSGITGLPFLDIDSLIEEIEGMPVSGIFRSKGEPYFRQIESAVLRDLCLGSGRIIGCGGGTVLSLDNRALLKARCTTVWLRVSRAEVLYRLEDPECGQRALLEGLDPGRVVEDLLRVREPYYREADQAVWTDRRSVEEVAGEIAIRLGLAGPAPGGQD